MSYPKTKAAPFLDKMQEVKQPVIATLVSPEETHFERLPEEKKTKKRGPVWNYKRYGLFRDSKQVEVLNFLQDPIPVKEGGYVLWADGNSSLTAYSSDGKEGKEIELPSEVKKVAINPSMTKVFVIPVPKDEDYIEEVVDETVDQEVEDQKEREGLPEEQEESPEEEEKRYEKAESDIRERIGKESDHYILDVESGKKIFIAEYDEFFEIGKAFTFFINDEMYITYYSDDASLGVYQVPEEQSTPMSEKQIIVLDGVDSFTFPDPFILAVSNFDGSENLSIDLFKFISDGETVTSSKTTIYTVSVEEREANPDNYPPKLYSSTTHLYVEYKNGVISKYSLEGVLQGDMAVEVVTSDDPELLKLKSRERGVFLYTSKAEKKDLANKLIEASRARLNRDTADILSGFLTWVPKDFKVPRT